MRAFLALLLLVPLSGCLQGDTGVSTTSFAPTCPNWTQGEHPAGRIEDSTLFNGGATPIVTKTTSNVVPLDGRMPADENGKRPDRYLLQLQVGVVNGTVEFRAYRNDTGQRLALYPANDPTGAKDAWAFTSSATVSLQVDLGPASANPSPAPLRVDATFTAATGHTIGKQSGAAFVLDPYILYRANGCIAK